MEDRTLTYVDIVFDGPPSNLPPRFIEVEDGSGRSISFGRWIDRRDGKWALRVPLSPIGEVDVIAMVICNTLFGGYSPAEADRSDSSPSGQARLAAQALLTRLLPPTVQ